MTHSAITLKAAPAPILAANTVTPSLPKSQDPSVRTLGPASRVYTIPPRARPGRRPMSGDNSSDRRKLQNRESQRAYRDRRADRVKELEQNLESAAKLHRDALTSWMLEKHQLQSELHKCRSKLREMEMQREIASASDPSPTTEHLPPQHYKKQKISHDHDRIVPNMPVPATQPEAMEIDFTNMFAERPTAPSLATWPAAEQDNCGFCTDQQNCSCKEVLQTAAREEAEEAARVAAQQQQKRHSKQALAGSLSATNNGTLSGPGTCDQCRADPERARQCQELARFAQIESRPPRVQHPESGDRAVVAEASQHVRLPPITVSCADFLGQIPRPRHPDHTSLTASDTSPSPYGEAFGRLRAYPYLPPTDPGAAHTTISPGPLANHAAAERSHADTAYDQDRGQHMPAFSIDATEAAVVLASLSNTEVKKQ